MNEVEQLIAELYRITLQQENAVNLELIPRYMRLLEEREEVIKKLKLLDIEKAKNIVYDNEVKDAKLIIQIIKDIDTKNIDNLSKQKKNIKKELDKIVNAKKVMLEGYDKIPSIAGRYLDNKN